MTRDGAAAFTWSKSSSSRRAAFFGNTLKFTPPVHTVAPSGAGRPESAVTASPVSGAPAAPGAGGSDGVHGIRPRSGGMMPQMYWQYSRTERSDEKRPARALFRIDIRVQRSTSR